MSEYTESDESTSPRAASGLFQSLSHLLASFVTITQTRLELLTTELEEEIHRASGLLVWALVALAFGGIGLFMVGLTVIVAFWDSYRLLAAILVTISFFLMAGIAVLALRAKIRAKPRLLDATRTELARDHSRLQSNT